MKWLIVTRTSRTLIGGLPALMVGMAIVGLLVSKSRRSARAQAIETFRGLPLRFEVNRGQTDPRVDFLARGIGHAVFLTAGEAVLVLTKPDSTGIVLRMTFVGANPRPRVAGRAALPGKVNYFVGRDPTRWRRNVPLYANVQYTELYPGIDLRYSGDQRQVACAFLVHPGADPRRIVFGWQGVDSLKVDTGGDLVLHTVAGVFRQQKPLVYQDLASARREIAGGYVRNAANQVGFEVAGYDAGRPLVITSVVPLVRFKPFTAKP